MFCFVVKIENSGNVRQDSQWQAKRSTFPTKVQSQHDVRKHIVVCGCFIFSLFTRCWKQERGWNTCCYIFGFNFISEWNSLDSELLCNLQAAMNKGNAFSLLEIKIILSLHKLGMIKVVPYNIHFLKLLFTPKKPNYAIPNRILLRASNRSI